MFVSLVWLSSCRFCLLHCGCLVVDVIVVVFVWLFGFRYFLMFRCVWVFFFVVVVLCSWCFIVVVCVLLVCFSSCALVRFAFWLFVFMGFVCLLLCRCCL